MENPRRLFGPVSNRCSSGIYVIVQGGRGEEGGSGGATKKSVAQFGSGVEANPLGMELLLCEGGSSVAASSDTSPSVTLPALSAAVPPDSALTRRGPPLSGATLWRTVLRPGRNRRPLCLLRFFATGTLLNPPPSSPLHSPRPPTPPVPLKRGSCHGGMFREEYPTRVSVRGNKKCPFGGGGWRGGGGVCSVMYVRHRDAIVSKAVFV